MVSYYSPLVPLTIRVRTQGHIVGVALLAVVDSVLMVLSDVMPFFDEMVLRWYCSRFVTMRTTARLRLSVTFPFLFNASPQLIRAWLCCVCSFRSLTAFALIQHSLDVHPGV